MPYLHAHGGVRLVDAARALGVTPEQVLKDLKVLFMCGLPGGYPDDLIDVDLDALESEEGELHRDGVIRVSNADYLERPMRLTPTEASAMIVALRALRAGAGAETVEIVDRVLVKLESAAADGPAEVPARRRPRTSPAATPSWRRCPAAAVTPPRARCRSSSTTTCRRATSSRTAPSTRAG